MYENLPKQWAKILEIQESKLKNPTDLELIDYTFSDFDHYKGKMRKITMVNYEITKPCDPAQNVFNVRIDEGSASGMTGLPSDWEKNVSEEFSKTEVVSNPDEVLQVLEYS